MNPWRAGCAVTCTSGSVSGQRKRVGFPRHRASARLYTYCATHQGFTYCATHQGFVYTAFVIDVFARRIVGWKVASAPNTALVLDALDQAIAERQPAKGLIHHSDRGVQYLSFRYSQRLADAEIQPSVGRVGSSYDNALAETVIGLFKTEVMNRCGPWRGLEDVEFATLDWVYWFNHHRLFEPIGDIPPAEAEANFYATITESAKAA